MKALSPYELVFGIIGCAAIAFFAWFDIMNPLSGGSAIPYVSILGFGLLARSRRMVLFLGLLACFMAILGYYLAPPVGENLEIIITNRQFSIIAILTITITSHIYMTRQEEFDEKLFILANTDQLTGLSNRHALMQDLEKRILEADRYNNNLSIILFDIDNFKDINDQFGHIEGDNILKLISKISTEWLRDTDTIGRFGGEEFIIVCPNTTIEGAYVLAERIRVAVDNAELKTSRENIKVTISAGITEYSDKFSTLNEFINTADEALYRAKKAGKNISVTSKAMAIIMPLDNRAKAV